MTIRTINIRQLDYMPKHFLTIQYCRYVETNIIDVECFYPELPQDDEKIIGLRITNGLDKSRFTAYNHLGFITEFRRAFKFYKESYPLDV